MSMIKVVAHLITDYGDEVMDKQHFAIGTIHEVLYEDLDGVYVPDSDGDSYLLLREEVEPVSEV